MKKCKYSFTKAGISEMYNDSLVMIFAALEQKNADFTLEELDIYPGDIVDIMFTLDINEYQNQKNISFYNIQGLL